MEWLVSYSLERRKILHEFLMSSLTHPFASRVYFLWHSMHASLFFLLACFIYYTLYFLSHIFRYHLSSAITDKIPCRKKYCVWDEARGERKEGMCWDERREDGRKIPFSTKIFLLSFLFWLNLVPFFLRLHTTVWVNSLVYLHHILRM